MGFQIKDARKTQQQLRGKTAARREHERQGVVLAAVRSSPAIANDLVPDLETVRVPIEQLQPAKRRARKPGKDHLANVMKCLRELGQVSPILIDRDHRIVDGHIVVEALRQLAATHVVAVPLDHLNEEQVRLVRIALNKLAEGSTWELEELRAELGELQLAGYDLTNAGFTLPELDIILQPPTEGGGIAVNDAVEEPPAEPVSRPGDLWLLGPHRLLCGDALVAQSYASILGEEKAAACFTDCPWNIPIEGFVSGLGVKKHKNFKMAAGEMSAEAFQEFVDTFSRLIAEHLEDGGVVYSCIDWRSHDRIVLGGERAGLKHINTIVWNKGSGGMGGLYRSAHELIPLLCKGKTSKTNNVELGRHGRDRTNVWNYPGANRPGSSAAQALKHHPTPKPVEMVEDALFDVTRRGELVLDPFMGSGTTLLAAEQSGRIAVGIELDPAYVDVCGRRWQEMTGEDAVNVHTRRTFNETAAQAIAKDNLEGGEQG